MFKRIFKWDEDERGIEGWIMRDMPHFDAGTGLTVAHDILEHFDNGTELEDEMQAFGAIVYGRVEGGYWSLIANGHYTKPAEVLSRDLSEFLFGHGQIATLQDRVTRPIGTDDDYGTEETFAAIAAETLRLGERDWDPEEDEHGNDIELTNAQKEAMRETMRRAVSWMRVGYRRAQRRWKFSNRETFASMFYELERKIEDVTKQGRFGYGDEFTTHDELHVSVGRNFDFVVKVKEYRDPYA